MSLPSSLEYRIELFKQMRAEEIKQNERSFRFVVARAVAKANVVMEYAEPFLMDQGKLLLQKANIEEKKASRRTSDGKTLWI